MSRTAFMLFFAFLGAAVAVPFVSNLTTEGPSSSGVLEDDICDYCVNLTLVKKCGNVNYCIRDVWSHQKLPPDNDDVCEICKNMVKQARDQLESNETQEELREVFEGSCKLIPIKVVSEECIKVSDEFIVELVSMLTSQMNPQIVCATCGLCNNARIDRLIAGERLHRVHLKKGVLNSRISPPSHLSTTPSPARSECDKCTSFTSVLDKKFKTTSFKDFRFRLLQACRSLGSFSDSCAAIVLSNADDLHEQIKKSLEANKDAACELTNMCPLNHKRTAQVEIINESSVGIRPVSDDQTCQFCEHMITHLRDILVANSTEIEFKEVMEGICKQLGKSKEECLNVVDQYYGMLYNFLVNHLNGQEICAMAGLCQQPGQLTSMVAPLLPVDVIESLSLEVTNPPRLDNDELVSPVLSQLPIERLNPLAVSTFYNKETCAFCEYFLHYVQDKLAVPATEAKVKKVVEEACDHLPQSINTQCRGFVESYGDAFIAIFIQQIDPSVICPGMGFCPNSDIVVFGSEPTNVSDKPGCPLCLLAVQEVTNTLKDNKTEENIRNSLENLCSHLSKSLVQECKLFVDAYSQQLVNMLIADLSPQEVCERLKLCKPAVSPLTPQVPSGGNILTNEIEDEPKHIKDSNECVICEFVISRLEKALTRNASEDEIEDVFYKICSHMPKTVEKQCNTFIDEYGRAVIELLVASADPKTVCTAIDLCSPTKSVSVDRKLMANLKTDAHKKIEECALCRGLTIALQTLMRDPNIEKDFNLLLERACLALPARQYQPCVRFIEVYGPSIENVVSGLPGGPELVCAELGVCVRQAAVVNLETDLGTTEGPVRVIVPRVIRVE